MADTVKVRFEPKMMIDGKLVDGQAGTFTNINPATEEYAWETDLGDKVISLTGTLTTRKVWREQIGRAHV